MLRIPSQERISRRSRPKSVRILDFEPLEPRIALTVANGLLLPTLSVASLADPTTVGQPVNLIAEFSTPTDGSSLPADSLVTFKDGMTTLGTSPIGPASISVSNLSVGIHNITAVYNGTAVLPSFASTNTLTQIVLQAPDPAKDVTGLTVTSTTQPSPKGSTITFTAVLLTTLGTAGSPTGSLSFLDGETLLATLPLNGPGSVGHHSYSTSDLSVGTHEIRAVYSGDSLKNPSVSMVLTQVVKQQTSLEYHVSPIRNTLYGQPVTIEVNLQTADPYVAPPTGTVTIYASPIGVGLRGDRRVLATLPVQGGTVNYSTNSLPIGDSLITVSYSGDDHFEAATTPDYLITHHVDRATSSIVAFSSGQATQTFGKTSTFSVDVNTNAPSTATPTGSLTFYDGTQVLGTIPYDGYTAVFSTPGLSAGVHPITVAYSGNDGIMGTQSGIVSQTIVAASTYTFLNSSAPLAVAGQRIDYTATVYPFAPGSGTPTGKVDFFDGSTWIGESALIGGQATFSGTAIGVGKAHPIHALYVGDGNFGTSLSMSQSETVVKANSRIQLASRSSSQGLQLLANLAPTSLGSTPPTGRIMFLLNGRVIGVKTLSNGSASLNVSRSLMNNKSFRVRYLGDSNFNSGLSSAIAFAQVKRG